MARHRIKVKEGINILSGLKFYEHNLWGLTDNSISHSMI